VDILLEDCVNYFTSNKGTYHMQCTDVIKTNKINGRE